MSPSAAMRRRDEFHGYKTAPATHIGSFLLENHLSFDVLVVRALDALLSTTRDVRLRVTVVEHQ
jgi:hypothetical protein